MSGEPRSRLTALTSCISALHNLFCEGQGILNISHRSVDGVNKGHTGRVDVVVCTAGGEHLLEHLVVPIEYYRHRDSPVDPRLLGFECQSVLREWLGDYDYYCYLEDDLILHDPWLFVKLAWFSSHFGGDKVLQPNRFEVGFHPAVHKVYIDGDLREHVASRYQDVTDTPQLDETVLGQRVSFRRPLNPHSGCYFLNAAQMRHWAAQPYFLDRDTSFVGPLESAATLGIMRAFKVYKPAPENANFLEIQHHGTRFMSLLRLPGQGHGRARTGHDARDAGAVEAGPHGA